MVTGQPERRHTPRHSALLLCQCVMLALVSAGCAAVQYETRPFFLEEQGRQTHGRKTWFDHLVEFDPGSLDYHVAEDYAQNPPRRIAVLPFVDRGSANFIVNKIPVSFRNQEE